MLTAVARTPLHHWHAAHGARFVGRGFWQVVAAYSSAEREADAARTGLGLADISADFKLRLRGPGVPSVVRALIPGGAEPKPRGVARTPNESTLVCRLTEDHVLLLAPPEASAALTDRAAGFPQEQRVVRADATCAYAGFWLLGPRCSELLCRLTHLDVRPAAFPLNSCAETSLAGVEALLVRTGELSIPSMRVYVPWDLGEYVWERTLQSGRESNITPVGLEALALLGPAARSASV
jgi:heterotetrameric sarcosine oxidase gamma subunit